MKIKVLIRYIYAETAERIYHNNLSLIHQIDENVALKLIEDNNYVLTKEDLVALLRDDGAFFFSDSMRIRSEEDQVFYLLSDEDVIEIDPSQQLSELYLWIKPVNTSYRKKIDDVNVSIKTLRQEVENIKKTMEYLFSFQKVLIKHIPEAKRSSSPSKSGLNDDNTSIDKGKSAITVALEEIESDAESELSELPRTNSDTNLLNYQHRALDLAVMYSEPLVLNEQQRTKAAGDPVDYEEECNKLLEILQEKNKQINLEFSIASHSGLANIIAKGPSILHIICHGQYDKEREKFYLCFENDGVLQAFYSDHLRDILEKVPLKIKLVFVNACHSEEVAKVFLEADVPCVVAIQSELRIADNVAQKFSQCFYDQIFEGKSVEAAFNLAKVAVGPAENFYTCCCAHVHKDDCPWAKRFIKRQDHERGHQYHDAVCKCKRKKQHIHNFNCQWAMWFTEKYQLSSSKTPDDVESDEIWSCCCSPELPHNERLKFKLLSQKDVDPSKMFLFAGKKPGKIRNLTPSNVIKQKFSVKRVMGRNFELYKLFECLTSKDCRFVQVSGSAGVGKTTLVKQIANYLHERKYFPDRISILMMEKTPSISHFLGDLYKEISDAYDFRSFCEAIKHKKVLFILEKCDLLLTNHLEEFSRRLRLISEVGKDVKFVIIAEEQRRLKLSEYSVVIGDLTPKDAVKTLLSFASNHLYGMDTILENLEDRDLFQKCRLNTHDIWLISERMKNLESLDIIEQDYLIDREENKANNYQSEVVAQTLENIQTNDILAYNFMLLVCLFPSGLSSLDMNQLLSQKMITTDWMHRMKRLLQNPQEHDEHGEESEDTKKDPDQHEKKTDYDFIKPGNYFWISIIKDTQQRIQVYQPAQFVCRFVENQLEPDPILNQLKIHRLEYLTLMALSIINQLKHLHYHHEQLFEYNSVSNHGLWAYTDDNAFYTKYIKSSKSFGYVDKWNEKSGSCDLSRIKKIFELHETNFLNCIEAEAVLSITRVEGARPDTILHIIEILWVAIPTVFSLISSRESVGRDLALRALSMLEKLDFENERVQLLRAKLHLFLVWVYLDKQQFEKSTLRLVNSELEAVELIQSELTDSNASTALSYYHDFARVIVFNKMKKGFHNPRDKWKNIKKYEELITMLLKCDQHLSELPQEYEVERCKVTMRYSKFFQKPSTVRRGIDTRLEYRLNEAIKLFNRYGLKRLELDAHYQLARLRLNLKRYHTTRIATPEDTSVHKQRLTDSLVQAKNYHLCHKALAITKQINDKHFEAKVTRLIDNINVEIRHSYFNVIILMKAAPIIESTSQVQKESRVVGFPTRVTSDFKRDVFKALNDKRKTLCLKFELLTKKNLIDALHNGCRLLHITCTIVSEGELVVEDALGSVERLSYEDLRGIFRPKQMSLSISQTATSQANAAHGQILVIPPSERYLDVLILGSKNDWATAEFFSTELQIPHVITFKFLNTEHDFRHKRYEDQCIDKFSQFFLENLVEGLSVQEAFDNAYQRIFDFLSEEFFNSKDDDYVKKFIGEGPILLPQGADHSEVLYDDEDYKLREGKVEDISRVRYPTNIAKMAMPYTDRKMDLHAVVKILAMMKDKFVHIIGDPMVGKTAFVIQTGHFLHKRNVFQDGVFYFSASNLGEKSLHEAMTETFGPKFDKSRKHFFRDKKMLLIFDNFDEYYHADSEFPRIIFVTLKECKISCIFVTSNTKKRFEAIPKKKWLEDYERKQKQIEDEFLHTQRVLRPLRHEDMAYLLVSLLNFDRHMHIEISQIAESPTITQFQGIPGQLVNNLLHRNVYLGKEQLEINPSHLRHVHLEHINHDMSFTSRSPSHHHSKGGLSRQSSMGVNSSLKISRKRSKFSNKSDPLSSMPEV